METKTRTATDRDGWAVEVTTYADGTLMEDRAGERRVTSPANLARAGVVVVLDNSQQHRLPTGYVTVTAPEGATDRELADAAGYCGRHFGFTVTRYEDGTATVALWND